MVVNRQQTDQTAAELFEVLRQLSQELHSGQKLVGSVGLDSSLDRDLGFDSLGRMELLRRIEIRFDISLTEQAFSAAETARDLLRAVLHADTSRKLGAPEQLPTLVAGESEAVPSQAKTLPEVLDWQLQHQPDRPHIHFYAEQQQAEILSYRQLHQGAVKVAAGLQQ